MCISYQVKLCIYILLVISRDPILPSTLCHSLNLMSRGLYLTFQIASNVYYLTVHVTYVLLHVCLARVTCHYIRASCRPRMYCSIPNDAVYVTCSIYIQVDYNNLMIIYYILVCVYVQYSVFVL